MKKKRIVFYGCLFVCVFFPLLTCSHPLINPVDPQAENYQGYTTVTTVDEVIAEYPLEGETLTWCEFKANKALEADLYGLQIAESVSGLGDTPDITSASNEIDASTLQLTEGPRYYRVIGRNASGAWGPWSVAMSFTTDSGVNEMVLSPEDGGSTTDRTPELSWNDISDAVSYQVEFSTSGPGLDGSDIRSTTSLGYHIPDTDSFAYGETCYWRVRGVNAKGITGVWSGVFEVGIREPEIGEIFEGGIVFYLDGFGGGLVCATQDHSTSALWGGYKTTVGGTATAVGTGDANTTAIVSALGTGTYAARLCYDLDLNGYSDWFLPSMDELDLMYDNLKTQGLGGFESYYYWSSSEDSSYNAWRQNFSGGSQSFYPKYYDYRVRAVRAFSY